MHLENRRTGEGKAAGLRVALFSGNYNGTRDGANNALNHLGRYLLDQGAALRVYSPTAPHPAFVPAGEVVPILSIPIPGRSEYRLALGPNRRTREDIERFAPTVFHLSAPDLLGYRAQRLARRLGIPVVASLHTRFETYLGYYGLGFARPLIERYERQFYANCDLVLAPSEALAALLRSWGFGDKVRLWSRGVDHRLFSPRRRSLEWRRERGYGDDELVLLFFGRLVREKGLDVFTEIVGRLRERGHRLRPLIVGDGPEHASFAGQLGDAVFTGHLEGPALARAIASADILLNPSVTEAFGNVNLEAMASGLVVVSADVASARILLDSATGVLVPADHHHAYVAAIEALLSDQQRREALRYAGVQRSAAFSWSKTLGRVLAAYDELGAVATDHRSAVAQRDDPAARVKYRRALPSRPA